MTDTWNKQNFPYHLDIHNDNGIYYMVLSKYQLDGLEGDVNLEDCELRPILNYCFSTSEDCFRIANKYLTTQI